MPFQVAVYYSFQKSTQMLESYILIGQTKKAHGAQGELKVEIKGSFLEDFFEAKVIFVKVQGKPVPYFIEGIRDAGDLLLKLEDVDSPAQAKELSAKEIFLRASEVREALDEEASEVSFAECAGYTLEDVNHGSIGLIQEVLEYPQQELALLNYGGKDILIPLHPYLVVSLDKELKKLVLHLPEGLLEL